MRFSTLIAATAIVFTACFKRSVHSCKRITVARQRHLTIIFTGCPGENGVDVHIDVPGGHSDNPIHTLSRRAQSVVCGTAYPQCIGHYKCSKKGKISELADANPPPECAGRCWCAEPPAPKVSKPIVKGGQDPSMQAKRPYLYSRMLKQTVQPFQDYPPSPPLSTGSSVLSPRKASTCLRMTLKSEGYSLQRPVRGLDVISKYVIGLVKKKSNDRDKTGAVSSAL
ncbi:hypothetical protein BDP27DRAFT_1477369 [Rhodocollybia butyracea]|uniref:Uncharacterized protein n=1 Tax=Rhodocollybia butyracea TaxID=206335 RepID=A0A9P5UCM1_9AGAR|nr:hypothetical protein BDP27DRAFT_1477369 [Rhodocollybia butyracea]